MQTQQSSKPSRLPDKISDEATRTGIRLAHEAGDAYRRQVEHFVAEVAHWGEIKRAGDYAVGFAVEEAEPLYHPAAGKLELQEPFADCNAHFEVVVMDAADSRFIPELDVAVHVWHEDRDWGTVDLPFLWHPTMFHYGNNVHLPEGGKYRVVVSIGTPRFCRHDKVNGRRYEQPVSVVFDNVDVKLGRK